MIKKLLLLILCCSCNETVINDTLITDDHELRIKAIVLSAYKDDGEKLYPIRERRINYSEDYDALEYVELKNGKEVFEKYVAEYQGNKLVSLIRNFIGKEFKTLYEYDQFGNLANYTYLSNDRHYQEVFTHDDQKLINHKSYHHDESGKKILSLETNYMYDSLQLIMNKVSTSPNETKSIKYTFDAQGRILSKIGQYLKYKIDYEGDTLINIEKTEGQYKVDHEITNTTIKFNKKGLLSEVIKVHPFEKNIFEYTYDKDDNPSTLIYIEEFLSGTKNYTKYEFGSYPVQSKFIFPSWFINCGVLNSNMTHEVDYYIKENDLDYSIENKLNKIFKSFPGYYIEYRSDDGINWLPQTRMDFEFEVVKK